jgi:hypothetical protein
VKILLLIFILIGVCWADNIPITESFSSTSSNAAWVASGAVLAKKTSCMIKVYQLSSDARQYEQKFSFQVNWIPEEVFISNSGNRIIFVNDQRGKGHGSNVVVVSDQSGDILKRWKLDDFYLGTDKDKLIQTITSVIWTSGGRWIDGENTFLLKRPKYLKGNQRVVGEYVVDVDKLTIKFQDDEVLRNHLIEKGE